MASESLEDYLKAIYNRLNEGSRVKTKDIALQLGVKPPSVTEMFHKLKKRGYIQYKKYAGVTLTDKGKKVGKHVSEVHKNLRKFLEMIQVPPDKAKEDACQMEHNLSQDSVQQLNKFINFVEGCPQEEATWLNHFHYYSKHCEFPPECVQKYEGERDMLTVIKRRLSELDYGQEGVIKEIDPELKGEIAGLGIREGKKIRMDTKQPINGPVVITVDRSMTSLGLDIAKKIVVEVSERK